MALGALRPLGFTAIRRRALAGLLPALERFFIAATRARGTGHRNGPESTGYGLQCFGVGVERRDILRRYTSAALR